MRRAYPFIPFIAGRVREPFTWRGHDFRMGAWVLMDLYGTNHDPRVWRDPDRVARDGLRAVQRGKRSVIPGGPLVKMFFGFNRVAPAWLAVPVARRMMSKELERGSAGQAELPAPPATSS